MSKKRKKDFNNNDNDDDDDLSEEEILSLYPELMLIPYETSIKSTNYDPTKHSNMANVNLFGDDDNDNDNDNIVNLLERFTDWIPFMFISSVRLGPIFIRRDWWFNKLLPHITSLDQNIDPFDDIGPNLNNWFDIEISLYTWALGGYVGLYNAQGFKYDRYLFNKELIRNHQLDNQFDFYHDNHVLSNYYKSINENENDDNSYNYNMYDEYSTLNWNVWNVTHLMDMNEYSQIPLIEKIDERKMRKIEKLRPRSSNKASSKNTAHPGKLQTARKILKLLESLEKILDPNVDNPNLDRNEIIQMLNANFDF